MRVLRILALGTALAIVVSVAQTTPYLGLPFEPKPTFADCYRQARCTGHTFVPTGRTICLSDSQVP